MNEYWSGQTSNQIVAHFEGLCFTIREEAVRPSIMYRPELTLDGDSYCALYGPNLQEGVAGFGASPDLAMRAFDAEWYKSAPAIATERGDA